MMKTQSTPLFRHSIPWQDLRKLSNKQIVFNLLLPYPFLVFAWWSAWQFWQVDTANSEYASLTFALLALFGWFLFFASSFRQAHDGFHHNLGIGKKATDWLLWWSSGLLISSNHAIKQTHLQHHRNPLSDDDVEAMFHKMQWWQAIIYGVIFKCVLQVSGYKLANSQERQKIILDFILIISIFILSIMLLTIDNYILISHILIMCIANSLVGFMAGWLVHHDCDETHIARTERHVFINILTFNQLYHQEHHLFPNVPSNNLPQLADRFDKLAPDMVSLKVLPESPKGITNKSLNKLFYKPLQVKSKLAKI